MKKLLKQIIIDSVVTIIGILVVVLIIALYSAVLIFIQKVTGAIVIPYIISIILIAITCSAIRNIYIYMKER